MSKANIRIDRVQLTLRRGSRHEARALGTAVGEKLLLRLASTDPATRAVEQLDAVVQRRRGEPRTETADSVARAVVSTLANSRRG